VTSAVPGAGSVPGAGFVPEAVFTWGAPPLKFGPGAVDEVGFDLGQYGVRRAAVVTDPGIAGLGYAQRVRDALAAAGIDSELFDQCHVEPTDASIGAAVDWARGTGPYDAFVAIGGGSSIDTAKAMDLLTSNEGDLLDYLNKPVGGGRAPTRALFPLIAIPTTAGTGSESTAMCVLDVLDLHVKTGISHWRLRPTMAVVDPELTMSTPAEVSASAGMDIVCHALESYTAREYTLFARKQAAERVTYCGANPVSDLWAEQALRMVAASLRRAVHFGATDVEARSTMMLAATFAGMGFGNAGVHIPHANAYPIAGRVQDYIPAGYDVKEPMVPHGQAVSLTAPAAFRFTFAAAPERHLRAAALLDPTADPAAEPSEQLPRALIALMSDIGIPNGIGAVGYGESDVDALVEGTLKQQRLLSTAPRTPTPEDLAAVFRESVSNW
jgi:alcohol dehydrogenase class IV